MTDEDTDLRERFAQLRAEELRSVPPFRRQARSRPQRLRWKMVAATVALLLVAVISAVGVRRREAKTFSDSDRAAVRSLAAWHAPTDVLLRTPGDQLLTTTPRIPDLKGIPR